MQAKRRIGRKPALRLATARDAAGIQAIYAPYVRDTCLTFEVAEPSVKEMAARIRRISPRWPWLVCEIDGEVAGYAYASGHRERAAFAWSVDVAIYVARRFQRRGVGRALYTVLFDLLTLQGYYQAYAGITLPNPASEALHRSMGFRCEGRFLREGFKAGAWRGVGWWSRPLQDDWDDPAPVRTVASVRRDPAWGRILRRGGALLGKHAIA